MIVKSRDRTSRTENTKNQGACICPSTDTLQGDFPQDLNILGKFWSGANDVGSNIHYVSYAFLAARGYGAGAAPLGACNSRERQSARAHAEDSAEDPDVQPGTGTGVMSRRTCARMGGTGAGGEHAAGDGDGRSATHGTQAAPLVQAVHDVVCARCIAASEEDVRPQVRAHGGNGCAERSASLWWHAASTSASSAMVEAGVDGKGGASKGTESAPREERPSGPVFLQGPSAGRELLGMVDSSNGGGLRTGGRRNIRVPSIQSTTIWTIEAARNSSLTDSQISSMVFRHLAQIYNSYIDLSEGTFTNPKLTEPYDSIGGVPTPRIDLVVKPMLHTANTRTYMAALRTRAGYRAVYGHGRAVHGRMGHTAVNKRPGWRGAGTPTARRPSVSTGTAVRTVDGDGGMIFTYW
ncbi:hypothetical protein GGX14DRAFT_405676 [Mycena pura]|uniref:Uncharacterized protein n=1 Tax=Mycena pura TaxID=153505 RepID=A0AAD6UVH0_9AGAR|nr:hypothetical protein GGX14DRAFT_405676 [Mycena pura]